MLASGAEHSEDFFEAVAQAFQLIGRVAGKRQGRLGLFDLEIGPQLLAGAGDGETFFIQELLDLENSFHIFAPVHALSGAALHRLELRELRFPEPKNVSRQAAEVRNLADAEVELVWNDDFARAALCFGDARVFANTHMRHDGEGKPAKPFLARSAALDNC